MNVSLKPSNIKPSTFLLILLFVPIIIRGINFTFPLPTVDFDQAMEQTDHYNRDNIDKFMRIAKNLYNNHILSNPEYSTEPRIPKIIHQIWIGSPFPKKWLWLRETWLRNHPDWKYILWTDKDIEKLGLTNKKLYDKATNYGEKSDIARYEILYRFGGLYIDTDFECLQPFDVLHHCCDFYAGLGHLRGNFYAHMSLIGCAKNHPFLEFCIKQLPRYTKEKHILARTGPTFFTKCAKNYLPKCIDKSIFFPNNYFYPWPHTHRLENSRQQIERWIRPESFAIHHWHVSWSKPKKRSIDKTKQHAAQLISDQIQSLLI